MAGSAVNLGGMLSQMAQDVGTTGGNIGRGLFNPMLEMQADERRKEAIIEGELRGQREAERQRMAQLERNQEQMRAISQPSMLAQQAIAGGDAQTLNTAADRLQEASIEHPNPQAMQQAAEYKGQVAQVKVAGAVKGIAAIDKALTQFKEGAIDPSTGLPIVSSQAAEMLEARKNALLREEGVSEAYQSQNRAMDKARDEVAAKKLDIQIKKQTVKTKQEEAAVQKYTGAVIQGGDIERVPPEHRAEVQKAITGYRKDQETASEITTRQEPLPKEVNDWAMKSDNPIVVQAANKLKSGTIPAGHEASYRKTIQTAWASEMSYRVGREREINEKIVTQSAQLRITDALSGSNTEYDPTAADLLEQLGEVDEEDRASHPLWKKYMAIAEKYSDKSPAALGEMILGVTEQNAVDVDKALPAGMPAGSKWRADGRVDLPDGRIATPPGWKS